MEAAADGILMAFRKHPKCPGEILQNVQGAIFVVKTGYQIVNKLDEGNLSPEEWNQLKELRIFEKMRRMLCWYSDEQLRLMHRIVEIPRMNEHIANNEKHVVRVQYG